MSCAPPLRLYHTGAAMPQVKDFAAHCELIECDQPDAGETSFALWHDGERLQLYAPEAVVVKGQARNLTARLVGVELDQVLRRSSGPSLLCRACGEPRGKSVFDPMAGWGLDALTLSAHGARVTQVEWLAPLWLLLLDLHRRAASARLFAPETPQPRCGDGLQALLAQDPLQAPQIVYLDPMYPLRRKGALPHKRMQWLAPLAQQFGAPAAVEVGAWLDAARRVARERVVLKRRLKDPAIARPDWSLRGRTSRFDVYLA